MKKYLVSLLVLVSVIALLFSSACQKSPPVPTTCISTLPDSAYVGQQLTFASCTQSASSFYWLFGDGGYATTGTATHTYTAPGIYHGSLATADGGNGNTKTFTIVVSRPLSIWAFQGITDTATYAQGIGGDTIQTSNFSAANINNISNIVFVFSALPATGGSYQVINDQFGGTPSATQVAIFLTTPSGRNYGSTGNDHVSATVTVTGGKVSISIPAVEMVNLVLPSDSASLSATVIQTE
jgi:PKD repeat protein